MKKKRQAVLGLNRINRKFPILSVIFTKNAIFNSSYAGQRSVTITVEKNNKHFNHQDISEQ